MQTIIQGAIAPDFQRISYQPAHYTVQNATLRGHLAGIDAALTDIGGAPPLKIAAGSTYRVRANTQVLHFLPIRTDGVLIVDGAFIQI